MGRTARRSRPRAAAAAAAGDGHRDLERIRLYRLAHVPAVAQAAEAETLANYRKRPRQ
jgi:hypothetical protein